MISSPRLTPRALFVLGSKRFKNLVSRLTVIHRRIRSSSHRYQAAFGLTAAFFAAILVIWIWRAFASPIPWQEPSYSFRLPLSIGSLPYSANDTTLSLVIPRKALPKGLMTAANIGIVARRKDGEVLPVSLGPQSSDAAILAWVTLTKATPEDLLLLYMEKGPADAELSFSPTLSPDLLLFDGFTDGSLLSDSKAFTWDPGPFAKDQVPFPWIVDAPGRATILPGSPNGYTIETEASETIAFSGGPSIVLAAGRSAVSFGMVDKDHWQAAIGSDSDSTITKTIAFRNELSKPVLIRLDVPQTAGSPIRFFLNGSLVFQSSLAQSMTQAPTLYLLRRDFNGYSNYHFVAVRSYQVDQPSITFGPLEIKSKSQ